MSLFLSRPFNEFGKQIHIGLVFLGIRLRRALAISIGSLAMGLVVLRGAIHGEMASEVAGEAIGVLIVFLGIGTAAGAIADYLVRDAVEDLYRKRVQWFREGVAANQPADASIQTSTTTSGQPTATSASSKVARG